MLQDAHKRPQAVQQLNMYIEILQTAAGLVIAQELDTEAGTGGIKNSRYKTSTDSKHE